MDQFNPHRMIGRIEQAARLVMLYPRYNDSLQEIVYDLSRNTTHLNEPERQGWQNIAATVDNLIAQTQSLDCSDDEARKANLLGRKEAYYIMRRYRRCYTSKLLELTDFDSEEDQYIAQRKAHRKRRLIRWCLIIVGLIVACIAGMKIYNLPYFDEIRTYSHVKDTFNEDDYSRFNSACESYFIRHTYGKHIEDVHYLKVEYTAKHQPGFYFADAYKQYAERWHHGQYIDRCNQLADSVWNVAIDKYTANFGSNPSHTQRAGLRLFRYMCQNHVFNINVTFTPNFDVKNFGQYSPEVRDFVSDVYSDDVPNLKYNIQSISSEIRNQTADWNSEILEKLNDGFFHLLFNEKYISGNFITFDDSGNADAAAPTLNITYTISNQESFPGIPDVWYSEDGTLVLLGLRIYLEADFALPDATGDYAQWRITAWGDPGNETISTSIGAAGYYATMCSRCCSSFAEDIIERLTNP